MDNTMEFLYEELAKATDGFSMANIIGQGGLGSVYDVGVYVDVYYSPFAFDRSYDTIIHPLPSVEDLLESDILAPPLRRLPGRPKKNRKRAKDELAPSTIRKSLATVRCKNCQELGHNSRGCQWAPIKAKRTPTTRAQGSNATSSQRMSQTNMSAQQKLKLKMMEKKSKKNGMQQNQQGSQQRAQKNSQEANQPRS
ncbi:hypothetical protein SESBI_36523 [Sesbania bispinosa]|nr:hypothetical protein SESBI_36523 [Sesbania bispinosa]